MKVTRVYADSNGESHFGEVELPLTLAAAAAGIPPVRVSPPLAAKQLQILFTPPETAALGWHPAPARQFVIFLSGALDVEVSDGEIRRFGPGAFVFVEDTWGKGHLNHKVNDAEVSLVFIPVDETVLRDGAV
jgi:hypothetical protein